jgi:hypothetical protein
MKGSLFHATVPHPHASARAESLGPSGQIYIRGEQRVALHEEYGLLGIEKDGLLDQVKLTSATPRMPGLSSWEAAEVAKADLQWFDVPHVPMLTLGDERAHKSAEGRSSRRNSDV